jgi:hypothetical protein
MIRRTVGIATRLNESGSSEPVVNEHLRPCGGLRLRALVRGKIASRKDVTYERQYSL